ncbi:hypothetical protein, partial [Hyphomonas sp.]|uniref:beta strand repeat-containing protein n=1 Tax=Hyphomonas sp. TaxID=87 RepID=UPI000C8BE2E5
DDLTIPDKIIHSGDTDTAIRFPAADTVSVETGGNEAFRVDGGQRFLHGASSSIGLNRKIQQSGTDASAGLSLNRFSADNGGAGVDFIKSRNATIGNNTIAQNNDNLGIINFRGADGSDLLSIAAQIKGQVDGTPGADDMPGRLVFGTTADGAATPTTRLTIDSAGLSTFTGNLKVSNTEPQIFLTDTNNNSDFKIRVQNGVLLIEDTTNNNADRFQIGSSGIVDIFGNLNVGAGIDVTGAITASTIITASGNLTTNGNFTVSGTNPNIFLTDTDNDSDYRISNSNGVLEFRDITNTTNRLEITSDGKVNFGSVARVEADGTFKAPNGNASTPAYNFLNDNDNGMFRATTNELGFSTAGTERLRIDNNGNVGIGTDNPGLLLDVVAASGDANFRVRTVGTGTGDDTIIRSAVNNTTSSNYIQFGDTGDSNSGQIRYQHANDSMQFTTNASEAMRLDSSGRLLLGTTTEGTTDSDDLTIATSGTTGITIRSGTSHYGTIHFSDATSGAAEYAGYIVYDHTNDKLDIGSNSSRFLSADSNSVVTLGKANFGGTSGVIAYGNTGGIRKDALLVLNATASVAGRGAGVSVGGTSSAIGSFYCNKAGNADSDGGNVFLESVGGLYFRTNGANDRANIDSNGNFLIGTSSVIAAGTERPFQIQNTGGPKIALGRNDTSISAGNTMGGIEFYGNDSDGTFKNCASIIVNADDTHSTNSKATRMQFFTTANNDTSATERLRITNAGQILIGGATASHGSSNADDLQIGANNQSNQTGITLGSASASSLRFADAGDDTAGAINYIHSDNTMRFSAGSSERVRIDSNGIKFNGDSSANNGLNDYEQGTWTATAEFTTGGFKSCANNVCRYVKIGNLVHVSGRFSLNNHTGATSGELRIEGLPFSKGNPSGDGNSDGICVYLEGAKTTVSTGISGLVLDNTTRFLIRQSGTTASGNDMTGKTDSGTTLLIGGTYSTFG